MRLIKTEINELLTAARRSSEAVHKTLVALPEGSLMSTKINGKPGYIRVTYENGKRHKKVITRESALVDDLLRRELMELEENELDHVIATLETAMAALPEDGPGNRIAKLLARHRELSREQIERTLVQRDPSGWSDQPYEQSRRYEEKKTQITSRGLHVRSKSEVLIAEALYEAGIPFRYEQILRLPDAVYAPDFTILRADGKLVYWEHCGRMFDRQYTDNYFSRLRAYYTAGIVPWDNLILTYDSLNGDIDLREIKVLIELRILSV